MIVDDCRYATYSDKRKNSGHLSHFVAWRVQVEDYSRLYFLILNPSERLPCDKLRQSLLLSICGVSNNYFGHVAQCRYATNSDIATMLAVANT